MIGKNRVIFTLFLLSLFFSISVSNVFALVEKKTISDLTRDSDNIITGKVLSRESYWENGNIFTNVTVSVNRHIKGSSGNKTTVKVRGGTVGNVYAEVSDVPLFDDNEEVLLFLKGNSVDGWNQGKYSIRNDSIKDTGEPLEKFVNNLEQDLQQQTSNNNITAGEDTGRHSNVISAKLDIRSMKKVYIDSPMSTNVSFGNNVLTPTIKYEGFENKFPNTWLLSGSSTWCSTPYNAYSGKRSGWNACGGIAGVASGGLYPNNMDAKMVYGPFSLVGATNPLLKFEHLTNTELYHDNFSYMASIDGANFYGISISGNWSQWQSTTFDLKNVYTLGDLRGQPNVWIAFMFTSDSATQNYGVFLDNIYIESGAIQSLTPHIISVTPNSGPARALELGSDVADQNSTQVIISGSAFGPTNGSVKFWSVGTIEYDATIVSWTNTTIVAKVPGRVSSATTPGGDGNVQVFTSDGTPSDNYGNFNVTYSYGGGKLAGNKITYMVNPNNLGGVNVIPAIQAATNTWNNAGANFGFVYGGLSSKTDVAMDGENSVIWVNYDTGSVATTTTWWVGNDTKTIAESDIVFNDFSVDWGTDNSSAKMDVQTVATHEFGHWLQLLDLYGNADSQKVMYGFVSDGEIKRVLDTEDIAGIKWIYGSGNPFLTGDILAYYRGLGVYSNIVETNDLLKAANDWRNNVIPQGFSVPITTSQLLALANEWRNS